MTRDFTSELEDIFDGYRRHHDIPLVRTAVESLLSEHSNLDIAEALRLRVAFRNAVVRCFEPSYTGQMEGHEKLDVLLGSSQIYSAFQPESGFALVTVATDIIGGYRNINYSSGIPCFGTLGKYPYLARPASEYVLACLDNVSVSGMKAVCADIRGTAYEGLVSGSHIESILDVAINDIGDANEDFIDTVVSLKSNPRLWGIAESLSPHLLLTHAPEIDPDDLPSSTDIGGPYYTRYFPDRKFLIMNFKDAVKDKFMDMNWIQYLEDGELPITYIIVNHALGVIDGTRTGNLTTEPQWLSHQLKYLAPALRKDVKKLVDLMNAKGIMIPQMPATVMPAGTPGGGINWAAHRAMRP